MAVDIMVVVLPGLVVGVIFGFVLQRGRFCMNSALRDILLLKDYTLLKAVALALLGQMIAFHAMDWLGIVTLSPKPLAWAGNILGGFIFGIGMALAAGCASGTTYRVGEGMMGSLLALLGYGLGAYTTKSGLLKPFTDTIRADSTIKAEDGSALTLGNILGPDTAELLTLSIVIVISAIGIGLIIWKLILPWKNAGGKIGFSNMGQKIFKDGWNWWVTGLAITGVAIIGFLTSAAAGRNYPLGITGGWIDFFKYFFTGDEAALSWIAFLVVGIIFGAFIASIISREFKLRAPKEGKTLLIQFGGGLFMGFGAVVAAGCNIGNLLSGIPLLSVGSIVSSVFIVLGTWVTAYLLFMRE